MATSTSAVQASAWNPTTIFPQLGGLQFGGLPFELREQIYQDAINAVKLIKFKAVQTGEETLDNWGRYIPEYSMRLSSLHAFPTLAVDRESRKITKRTLSRKTELLGTNHFSYHFSNIRPFIEPNYHFISFKLPFKILSVAVDVRNIHDPEDTALFENTAKLLRILSLFLDLQELILIVPELEPIYEKLCIFREVPQPLYKPRTTSLAASRLMQDMGKFRCAGIEAGSTRAYKEGHRMKDAIEEVLKYQWKETWSRGREYRVHKFTIRIDRWDHNL